MDRLLMAILEFLDHLTLGTLSRWGAPDPDKLWEEAHRREPDQLERVGLVGGVGVAITSLRPSGKVEVGGRAYEAASEGDFIDRGTRVEVIGCRGFALIVRARSAIHEGDDVEAR